MPPSPHDHIPLEILPEAHSFKVFALAALLAAMPKQSGTKYHAQFARASRQPLENLGSAAEWLGSELNLAVRPAQVRRAEKLLRQWLSKGFWTARVTSPGVGPDDAHSCPRTVFGHGAIPRDAFLAAFFNSRKPRAISPQALWLQGMRAFMENWDGASCWLASSLGTLTHDMATHMGLVRSIPVILVVHDPFDQVEALHTRHGFPSSLKACAVLTCQAPGMVCPKGRLMVCRDRLLASLAHVHMLLDVRRGGNLHRILQDLHVKTPRPLWFVSTHRRDESAVKHEETARSISAAASPLFTESMERIILQTQPASSPILEDAGTRTPTGGWSRYLYHYTRSCWGPWPGQSYREYLESLYEGRHDAGHTALDTLARILAEKRIRGGSRTTRGSTPVVCWTIHCPANLQEVRHWNRALMRWTFEPYGIAVLRDRLKALGVKPTIYAPAAAFHRLKPSEQYRFQRHEPPHICWRHEREHRLSGDLCLADLEDEDFFVFVPRKSDAAHLRQWCSYDGKLLISPVGEEG